MEVGCYHLQKCEPLQLQAQKTFLTEPLTLNPQPKTQYPKTLKFESIVTLVVTPIVTLIASLVVSLKTSCRDQQ